jgi:HK97 family phage major capsid protein
MAVSSNKIKRTILAKRAEQRRILDAVMAEPITRDLNTDEQARIDALESDVVTLKAQVAQLQAIEDDEEEVVEDDEEEVVEEDPAERTSTPRGNIRRSAGRVGKPIGQAPAIHTKKRSYSILRAISCLAALRPVDGLEGEISQEISRQTGRQPGGFFMPTSPDDEMLDKMYPARRSAIRRDLTTSTGTGAIFLVPELPMIDLLRAKLIVRALGARFLDGLKGTFAFPRQDTHATPYWLGEGNSATPSNQTVDQVPFTPKVCIALTNISREFMNQTSVDADTLVKNDLAETMARELDRVALNGSGGTQPTGILQNSTIVANSAGIALGTNGGPMTYAAAVAMEGQVAGFNADMGSLAYCTSPALRAELKGTPKINASPGYPIFTYEDGLEIGVGIINGYPTRTTTNMPVNGTKGTTSGTCKSIIYGNWNDLIVGQWEGVDVLVNPYTLQAAGAVVISMQMSVDCEVRHPESFAIITDAT